MNVLSSSTTESGRSIRVLLDADLDTVVATVQQLGWIGTTIIRAYVSETEYRLINVNQDAVLDVVRARTASIGLAPQEGQIVVISPEPEGRVRGKQTRVNPEPKPALQQLYEVGLLVQGGSWAMLTKVHGKEHALSGTVTGKSGQEKYLLSLRDALGQLKVGKVSRVVIQVEDRNIARMLKGEMQSKKNAPLLHTVRELLKSLPVEIA